MSRRDCCIIALLVIWLLTSVAALAGMYHLWWTRERALYLGKSVDEQRVAIFQRAGLPRETLELAKKLDAAWPVDIAYKAAGSEIRLSYLKYLLLPRSPSGSGNYRVNEDKQGYSFAPETEGGRKELPFSTVAPSPRGFVLSAAALLFAAIGLGRFGLTVPEGMGCAALLLCILTVPAKGALGSIDAAGWSMILAGAAGLFAVQYPPKRSPQNARSGKKRAMILLVSAVLLGAILWSFLMAVVVGPDDWDAWAQWGPKAKILALPGGKLPDVRHFVWGSGDYPLLWPALWAFSGWCAGGWEEQWSKAWGPFLLLLTAWQMGVLSFRFSRRIDAGLLTAAIFVSMPAVPLVASWAYAEAPLWLFLVCATGRMLLWQQSGKNTDLLLAALFAAGAACTKNEGGFFVALSALWVIANSRRVRDLCLFLVPSMLTAGLWKAYAFWGLDASNRAMKTVQAMDWNWGQWLDILPAAAAYVLRIWSDVRQWNIVLPVVLLASVWIFFKGFRKDRINLLLPVAFLAGLLAVVLSHGPDWSWQLGAAWNRLTIQWLTVLVPVVVCGLGCRRTKPEAAAP